MRKAMTLWAALLVLLLAGCSSPENRDVLHYIQEISPFEQSLTDFKSSMAQIQGRPQGERAGAFKDLAGQVRQRRGQLEKLTVPPPAQALHTDMLALYDVLARFMDRASQSSGPGDAELQKLAGEWQTQMKTTDDELSRLSSRYK